MKYRCTDAHLVKLEAIDPHVNHDLVSERGSQYARRVVSKTSAVRGLLWEREFREKEKLCPLIP